MCNVHPELCYIGPIEICPVLVGYYFFQGCLFYQEHVELFIPWNMLHYSFPGVFILPRTNNCSLQHWLVEGLLIWGLGSEPEYAFEA